jgi:transketolase
MNRELLDKLTDQCYKMKVKALEMARNTGSNGSHIGGAFSSMEIFAALYSIANIEDPKADTRDRIIVSKGHCVLSYYTALWQKGFVSEDELNTFDTNGTSFHGHPHRCLDKGMEFSAGSLGLGMSFAVGVALACKSKGINNRIYVLLGDGECNEGIVWESLMAISNYNLYNMTIIVDWNKYQVDGATSDVMNIAPLKSKFEAFGFDTTIVDGHDLSQLYDTFGAKSDKPKAIIADTIKANGISFLVNTKNSHHSTLTPKKYSQALEEIQQAYGKL